MTPLCYHPDTAAGWLAVASSGQLLVVQVPVEADRVASFWLALQQGFQQSLDELTRNGISATPHFALLAWSGDVSAPAQLRVIVRGAVTVSVDAPDARMLDGTGVSTWTEQAFDHVTGFDVVVTAAQTGSPTLPLVAGAAVVSRVRSASGSSPSDVQSETPAPVEVSVDTIADRPTVTAAAEPEESGYDHLFGATMMRNVSEAAVRENESSAAANEAIASQPGDHDGMTIMTGDLKKLRGGRKSAAAVAVPEPAASALYLELSTGSREPLTQTVLVGRSPTVTKVSGGALPKLVTIPGDQDISRNHAQFAVEGGTVVVTDLHSRNGTQIILPGKPPQQLRQGEPTSVIVGTIVDLGGGVTLTICEEK